MSALMETKVDVNIKPDPEQRSNASTNQKRQEQHRNNGNTNRGFKHESRGSFGGTQRTGGYRRGGSSASHQNEFVDKDQSRHYQRNNNQRQQNSEDNAGHTGGRNIERIMYDKLNEIGGPSYDLRPIDCAEKKFSGRSRLYLGNIPPTLEETEITDMLKDYGEVHDIFLNRDKKFSFVRMDYHHNAEKAKSELNGKVVKNYTIKVRFAPHGSTVKLKNLDEHVSNELLHLGFSVFGEVDRAVVSLDDHGKPTGEGVVEFTRKNSAMLAVRKCTDSCFFLTQAIRPVLAELYEPCDDQDGYSDRFINKNNPDYHKARAVGPRIAHLKSFEHEFGMRWKQLYELHKRKQEALIKELDIDKNKLIAQMEYARYEHETALLREELRSREMDMDRQKRDWEQKHTQAEEERRKADERMRRHQERMQSRVDDDRQKQETNLFLQAQQLTNMLECQEKSYFSGGDMGTAGGVSGLMTDGGGGGGGGGDGGIGNDLFSLGKRRRY